MRLPNGEIVDAPSWARIPDARLRAVEPILARIAGRSSALYAIAQPIAANYYHHRNAARPLTFASERHLGTPEEVGTVRVILGRSAATTHDHLYIGRAEDGELTIARDLRIDPNESQHIEVSAVPTKEGTEHDYGEFAVSVFKRFWSGWPQGRFAPEDELHVPEAVEDLHEAVREARAKVNRKVSYQRAVAKHANVS